MDIIKFLIVWATLGSAALGIIAGFAWMIMTHGLWFILLLPVALFLMGLCLWGIAEASVRLSG